MHDILAAFDQHPNAMIALLLIYEWVVRPPATWAARWTYRRLLLPRSYRHEN